MGGFHAPIDHTVKLERITYTWEKQKWEAVLLTDVRYPAAEGSVGETTNLKKKWIKNRYARQGR